jgi:hypothetical protein
MSGRKTTRVSPGRPLADSIARMAAAMMERAAETRRQRAEEQQRRREDQRQRQHEREVDRLRSRLKKQEQAGRKLSGLIREVESAAADSDRRLLRQVEQGHAESQKQCHDLSQRIETERKERRAAQKLVTNRLTALENSEEARAQAAGEFLSGVEVVAREVAGMPHDRFAPGQLDKVQRHIDDARSNMAAGHSDAALATAQSAYWGLADLRSEVSMLQDKFDRLHQETLARLQELLREAGDNHHVELDGEQGKTRLDVDFWTDGELKQHEGALKAIQERLETEADQLTVAEVEAVESEVAGLENRTSDLVDRAVNRIVASQVRANTAAVFVEAAESHGFELVDSTYEGGDERGQFIVSVRNLAGSERVAVVFPVGPDDSRENEVEVHSFEETFVDENTQHQRAAELANTMRELGVEVSSPKVCGTGPDPEVRDIEAARTRKSARTPR